MAMVAVSVWGGAHDGARFLAPHRSVRRFRDLRYLGHSYIIDHDERTGWKAVYPKGDQPSPSSWQSS